MKLIKQYLHSNEYENKCVLALTIDVPAKDRGEVSFIFDIDIRHSSHIRKTLLCSVALGTG